MKKRTLTTTKLLTVILAIVCMLAIIPSASAASVSTFSDTSTATLEVSKAKENDKLAIYKIIDITYDSTTNTLKYQWNADFSDYFNDEAHKYTVEEFSALSALNLKATLGGLQKYITDNNIIPTGEEKTVGADGTASWSGLAMGGYFVLPIASTEVYAPMFTSIQPEAQKDGTYLLTNTTFDIDAKHKSVDVQKNASKVSATIGEDIVYSIEADVPYYDITATNKAFSLVDELSAGLTLDTTTVKVFVSIDGIDFSEAPAESYTLDASAAQKIIVSISDDQYENHWVGDKKIKIEYKAKLNEDAVINGVGNPNTVTYTYSHYPYTESATDTKTDTAIVYSYGILIEKYASGTETKLQGAKFKLYREPIDGETGIKVDEIDRPGGVIPVLSEVITDANGVAKFIGLEADVQYFVVETAAPSGYNKLSKAEAVKFTVSQVNKDGEFAGYFNVKIDNSKGFRLPSTGGAGTVVFSVLGILLMAAAIVLVIVFLSKGKSKKHIAK